jgi:hypothetical protein
MFVIDHRLRGSPFHLFFRNLNKNQILVVIMQAGFSESLVLGPTIAATARPEPERLLLKRRITDPASLEVAVRDALSNKLGKVQETKEEGNDA